MMLAEKWLRCPPFLCGVLGMLLALPAMATFPVPEAWLDGYLILQNVMHSHQRLHVGHDGNRQLYAEWGDDAAYRWDLEEVAGGDWYYLRNLLHPQQRLHVGHDGNGQLYAEWGDDTAYQWRFELAEAGHGYYLRNRMHSDQRLHVGHDGNGRLYAEWGDDAAYLWTVQVLTWAEAPADNDYQPSSHYRTRDLMLANVMHPGQLLHSGAGMSMAGTSSGPVDDPAHRWRLEEVGEGVFFVESARFPDQRLHVGHNGNGRLYLSDTQDPASHWTLEAAGGHSFFLRNLLFADQRLHAGHDGNGQLYTGPGNDDAYRWRMTAVAATHLSADVEAGPIWDNGDAQSKCAAACAPYGGGWHGNWKTTVPGAMSVCSCRFDAPWTVDLEAGPIWGDGDAPSKCAAACAGKGSWHGNWKTTVPGAMSVCGCTLDSHRLGWLSKALDESRGHCQLVNEECRSVDPRSGKNCWRCDDQDRDHLNMRWQDLSHVTELEKGMAGPLLDGRYIYVFRRTDGRLVIRPYDREDATATCNLLYRRYRNNDNCRGPSCSGYLHVRHSQLNGGWNPVWSAGEMKIEGGKVVVVNNKSGHFRPPAANVRYVADTLQAWGIPRAHDLGWGSFEDHPAELSDEECQSLLGPVQPGPEGSSAPRSANPAGRHGCRRGRRRSARSTVTSTPIRRCGRFRAASGSGGLARIIHDVGGN